MSDAELIAELIMLKGQKAHLSDILRVLMLIRNTFYDVMQAVGSQAHTLYGLFK